MNTEASRQLVMESPVGWLQVTLSGDKVVMVDILPDRPASASRAAALHDVLMDKVAAALQGYFTHRCWPRGLPLVPTGTPFQRRVWERMLAIEPGQTRSYGDIAEELGSSARAVGNACRANPIPLLIPCHRVVAKNGLGGFGGETRGRQLQIKAWLLQHEQGLT